MIKSVLSQAGQQLNLWMPDPISLSGLKVVKLILNKLLYS